MELNCQHCGEPNKVQGFLAAAEKRCIHCGKTVMGGGPEPEPVKGEAGMWLGMCVGALIGIGVVAAFALAGTSIPLDQRGFFLAGLSGVLVSPILLLTSFFSMLILPFSLEGVLGDGVWTRLARANNERRVGPLILPFLYLVGLPMLIFAVAGTRLKAIPEPLLFTAGAGAMVLGAMFGAIVGAMLSPRRGPC